MGAHIYAKAAFVVFVIVTTVLVSVFVSFFVVPPLEVTLPESSVWNGTAHGTANYSGFQLRTLQGNLMRKCLHGPTGGDDSDSLCGFLPAAGYTLDYTTGALMSFATVFAVMFNGCTGIMAGSNMSGQMFSRNTRPLSPAGVGSM